MGTDICRVRCPQRRMPGQTALGTAHTTADRIREIRVSLLRRSRPAAKAGSVVDFLSSFPLIHQGAHSLYVVERVGIPGWIRGQNDEIKAKTAAFPYVES